MKSILSQGFRLSPQQQRLWSLHQEVLSSPFYAQSIIQIDGCEDLPILEKAVENMVEKYEIFRTVFQSLPNVSYPLQVVAEQGGVYWHLREDLRGLTAEEQDVRIAAIAQQLSQLPFDWEQGPLFYASIANVSLNTYVLCLTLPALCADQVTLNKLVHEIGASYESLKNNTGSGEAQETLQYVDCAEWQNELLIQADNENGRAYWRAQKLDHLFEPAFPFERQPALNTFAPAVISASISGEIVTEIDSLVQSSQIAAATFLLTCWQALLWRYTERPQTLIGVEFDGRRYADLASVPGLFMRSLPFSSEIDSQMSFQELLKQNEQILEKMYEVQESFSWEEGEAGLPSFIHAPYFPAGFAFEERNSAYQTDGTLFASVSQIVCSDRFHIKLLCSRSKNSYHLEFHYDTDVLSSDAVTCLAEQFSALVESALQTPASPLQSLNMLSDSQKARVLTDFNANQTDFSPHMTIVDAIMDKAHQTPDAIAGVFEDEYLTYAELQRRALYLASSLRTMGVRQEVRVGICMERSLELVIGLLGILKAGGCYVPLDPGYPRERLNFMLEDARVDLLLTQERFQTWFTSDDYRLICIEQQTWEEAPALELLDQAEKITGETTAYIIYTSGSTGRPKGVMLPHSALFNHMSWMQMAVPLRPTDRVLQKTSLSFDASVWEFFAPLIAGAQLVVAFPDIQQDSGELIAAIQKHQITILQTVPSLLRLLLLDEQGFRSCRSLRRVFCGGEKLTIELQRQFFQCSDASLYNLYGPTESCIDATIWECKREDDVQKVLIGHPIANTSVYFLDAQQQPVAIGIAGELCIGGAGLARGYFNRPEITAERFIPNPFAREEGGRLYRTGDIGRFLPDGTIEFIGRRDHQVKLRGFRIELGEIEDVLEQHPAVEKGLTLIKQDTAQEQSLVAYITLRQEHTFTIKRLLELEQSGAVSREKLYELPNGMPAAYLNKSEIDQLYKEIFEDEEYLKHAITLSEGDCVFDIGANIGMFTLFLSQRYKNLNIFAFEPVPAVCKILRLNASLYNPKARVFECGISDKTEVASLTFYPHVSVMSSRYADSDEERELIQAYLANQQQIEKENASFYKDMLEDRLQKEQINCQMRTISEIIREYDVQQIDLLKVDTEKSELEVISGIAEEDWPKIRQIVMEIHDIDGRLEEIQACLIAHGYTVSLEQETSLKDTNLYNLFAVRQSEASKQGPAARPQKEWFSPSLLLDEIHYHLAAKLPAYMLPSHYVIVQEWPLTANGKIDLQALPAPERLSIQQDMLFIAPHTEIEIGLADIWSKILKREQISMNTNFFRVGGHSLLVPAVISQVQSIFHLKLPIRSLFEKPTLAEFAQYLEAQLS